MRIKMKTSFWIGIVIILAVFFSAGGLIGIQSNAASQNLTIEKIVQSEASSKTLNPEENLGKDEPIFSRTTVITLVVAVMGIVAFRRNTYL